MFPDLDPPFSKVVRDEALGYEPIRESIETFPGGLSSEAVARLYSLSTTGDKGVVPELKQLIKRYPDAAFLMNYLSVALHRQGKTKEALKVERETFVAHPHYFFARLSEAQRLTEADRLDEAKQCLGGTLRLADFKTSEPVWHFSHWENFYSLVASWYAAAGMMEEAQGLIEALRSEGAAQERLKVLEYHVMRGRLASFQKRMAEDASGKIEVVVPDYPRLRADPGPPEFHHPEIGDLYRFGADFPASVRDALLALPRESLVADLEKVIEDAMARGPWFMEFWDSEETTWFPLHAIFLLGEAGARGSLPAVLRFLEQHPDILGFWLGDSVSWHMLYPLVDNSLPELGQWMKTPGVSAKGKESVIGAVTQHALHHPAQRDDAVAWMGGLIDFFLATSLDANVIDTRAISSLVAKAIDLRAVELLPRIEALYDKRYISEIMIGDFESVRQDISASGNARDMKQVLPMLAFYRQISGGSSGNTPADAGKGYKDLFGGPAEEPAAPAVSVGRNDPCPCGSGKKYKKCCL